MSGSALSLLSCGALKDKLISECPELAQHIEDLFISPRTSTAQILQTLSSMTGGELFAAFTRWSAAHENAGMDEFVTSQV